MAGPRLGTVANVDRAFYQCSKKLLSSSPEQVDFLAGQVTLQCLIRKGTGKSSSNKIINQDKQEVALGEQNVRAACPKDKLE